MKLDRKSHSTGNIFEKKNDSSYYKQISAKESGEVFAYLQSVAYNYPLSDPPRMNKTIHSTR